MIDEILNELNSMRDELKQMIESISPSCEMHKISNYQCNNTNVQSITFQPRTKPDITLYLCKSCFELVLKVRGELND